ncbi:DUF1816 domain-containing protein [Nostoc sp.]|uniref:DUF1816 domain-containing protein n=1 Tax=Nostoc sp. TaxID=1180 RepID=UPI002FF4B128
MNLFSSNQSELFWWVEINTTVPHCTYYFGPFDSKKEAQLSRTGYVEDLYQEEARGIVAVIKQCQPDLLTVFQDEAEAERNIFSF